MTNMSADVRRSLADGASRRAMEVLQLGMSWFPEQAGNGLDRMYYGLVRHLPEVGVRVRGLVAGSSGVARSPHAVQAFASEHAPLLTRLRGVRRRVKAEQGRAPVDLVASHFALYTAPVLDAIADVPLVVHFHGPWAAESAAEGANPLAAWVKGLVERLVYRRGTRFIVLSEAFRDVLHRQYGVDLRRIRIVPGGTDVDRFDTGRSRVEAREALGWPKERPILLSVRRLARRMGLENLIDAMVHVRQAVPDVQLYIAGKGPIEAELTARIRAAGLQDHVALLGFVPDDALPLAYRAADVSVVPTVALEGFGLITVESLAAGTPVLVTPVGGLPEVVRDLSEALILESPAPDVIAPRLVDVLQGRADLPSDAACQRYARQTFDWPVIARKTRAVYAEVLA